MTDMTDVERAHQEEFVAIVKADPDHNLPAEELRQALTENRDPETLNLRETAILSLITMVNTTAQRIAAEYPSFMRQDLIQNLQQGGIQSLKVLGVSRRELAQASFDFAATQGVTDAHEVIREHEERKAKETSDETDMRVYGVSSGDELSELLNKIFGERNRG